MHLLEGVSKQALQVPVDDLTGARTQSVKYKSSMKCLNGDQKHKPHEVIVEWPQKITVFFVPYVWFFSVTK